MTRVCIVNATLPPDAGGAELAAWRYAQRLRRVGGEAVVLAPATGRASRREDLPEWTWLVRNPGADGSRLGAVLRRLPAGNLVGMAGPLWRRMTALRSRFDVVHIFNGRPLFNLLAVPAARMLGKPVVIEMSLLGSDDPLTLREESGRSGAPLSTRLGLRYRLHGLADRYVTKSTPLTEAYLGCGLPQEKLRRVPYGVDVERYAPATEAERAELRAQLGLDVGGLLVLFVGGMSPRKGLHHLLAAFRGALAEHPDARLVLLGPADRYGAAYLEGLTESVKRWEIEANVEFVTGFAENVHEYMRAADIFALPSEREGLPIAVLEAMACGLTVIASDIPEIAGSEIEPGREGLLVPPGDEDALTRSLVRAMGDAELRRRLGVAARSRAEREFSETAVDRSYRELYQELTGASVRPISATAEALNAGPVPNRTRGES